MIQPYYVPDTHFISKATNKLRVKNRNLYSMQTVTKRAQMAILTLYKIDFKSKSVTRDKGHFILIKRSTYQEYITIVNTCTLNNRAQKHMKQNLTELKKENDS